MFAQDRTHQDLPKQSLHFDTATLRRIENSKIKRSIVKLIMMMHQRRARRIALLSWNLEEETRRFGQLLTLCLSQQLEQKCALAISEGLKPKIDVFPSFAFVTLPEIEEHRIDPDDLEEFETAVRNFPIQIFAGPPLEKDDIDTYRPFEIAREADAHVLLVPERGLSKYTLNRISSITEKHALKWLCLIPLSSGELPS